MHLSDFDYDLPSDRIARTPVEPRDASRMLVLDATGHTDARFRDLPGFLRSGDVVVLNDTRVLHARTAARLERRGGAARDIEVFFAEPAGPENWRVLCKPGRRIRPGDRVVFGGGEHAGRFLECGADGLHVLEIPDAGRVLERFGRLPLPPYLGREPENADESAYQTVFARQPGAVAAPTAGLHFTAETLEAIRSVGAATATITLHVGIGTFLPVRTDDPARHVLHPERYNVGEAAAATLRQALREGRRVIAVGTTSTRTLEYLMLKHGTIPPGAGQTDLYILPGFRFRIVSGLLTNFHLPRSTLLMLVSAFAGRQSTLAAYRHAVAAGYRFYSYGDCMLVLRERS